MPRLSLYRPEKGNDFKFIDRAINEQFQVGGTDVFIHKYLGPVNPAEGESTPGIPNNTNPIGELGIQDLIFMENRDRHYDSDVYQIRGIYTMQDIDFNLSQFGLFLQNDNVMITFHLRATIDTLGRKIMPGDVFELPHLKDEYALDDSMVALKRFYVVTDVSRAATGFSQTWYPHLLRAKCEPLVDSQEFKEILDAPAGDGNKTLRDVLSVYNKSLDITKAIVEQAEIDAPLSGYNNISLFTIPLDENGLVKYVDASNTEITVDSVTTGTIDATTVLGTPEKNIYVGYLTDDGVPPNGAPYSFGISFPLAPTQGQFHLRTDYFPNRLFRWDGSKWIKFEDNVRMTINQLGTDATATGERYDGKPVRLTQRGTFVNNDTTATIGGKVVPQKQALSKILKPQADN